MAAPTEPYIDINTGSVHYSANNNELPSPCSFVWYNSNTAGGASCTVTVSGNWTNQSSYGPIAPQATNAASVNGNLATGYYSWSCPCCSVGSPRTPVKGGH
jgi:hypothetical protein